MTTIDLREEEALARGRDRLVFQHPEHPDRVIKVMRRRYAAMIDKRGDGGLLSRSRRFGALKPLAWDVAFYLECCARRPEILRMIPEVHGFERTSLGLGLVCEKIDDGQGGLAPTLGAVVAGAGLDARIRAQLEALAARLARGDVVFRDISPSNIVVARDRLVVVDGFGDIRPLPLRRLWRSLNAWLLRRDLRRLLVRVCG